MDFSFSDLNLQLDGQPPINFNSVENLPGFEARAAFTVIFPPSDSLGQEFCRAISNALNPDIMRRAVTL